MLEIIAPLNDMFVVQRISIEMKIEYHDYQGEEENKKGGQDQTDVLKKVKCAQNVDTC